MDEQTGVSTHDVPDDGLLSSSNEQIKPCQVLDGIMQIEDEEKALELIKKIASLLSMDLEESPSEENEWVNAVTEPQPLGVPWSDFENCIQEMSNKNTDGKENDNISQNLAYLSEELLKMDELFDKVKNKIGEEKLVAFLGLFSLASRKSNPAGENNKKGKWKVEINGKKINAKNAEFKVDFKLKHDYVVKCGPNDYGGINSGGNVFRTESTFCNDNFTISVSPQFTRHLVFTNLIYMENQEIIEKTQVKTIDELADLLIDEIYDTIKLNNTVDWYTDTTLTAVEIVLTVAAICTGVGGALVATTKLARAASIGMVVMESSNLIETTTRFLGPNHTGYNPLLEASRYLDKKIAKDRHPFEATFHGLNMMIAFGKKPVTKVLSALTTGAAGTAAGIYLIIDDGGEQQVIESFENVNCDTN